MSEERAREIFEHFEEDRALAEKLVVDLLQSSREPAKVAASILPHVALIASGSMTPADSDNDYDPKGLSIQIGEIIDMAMGDNLAAQFLLMMDSEKAESAHDDAMHQIASISSYMRLTAQKYADITPDEFVDNIMKHIHERFARAAQTN